MQLNDENYFSAEADKEYMSVSQFKSFLPRYGGCEAKAIAKLQGKWKAGENTALLVGSYVHANFEGTLEKFKQDHKEIFTKQGSLKSEYQTADYMIKALETDESFQQIYTGEKEKIFTFNLFSIPWKIKVDCLNLKDGYFVDLKTTKDFQSQWDSTEHARVSFVEAYGYIIQVAVYREGIKIATNRGDIDGYIVAVTKQSPPDKAVLYFTQEDYNKGLVEVAENLQHIMDLKNGIVQPVRCESCDYCRATKKLNKAIHYREL